MKIEKKDLARSPIFFDDLVHAYITPEGELLSGVTSLLKEYGLTPPEYEHIPQEVLDKAAARGTAIHTLLEDYDNGKSVVGTPELESYANMLKQEKMQVIESEYLINNDIVASKIDKVLSDCSIADVKTSSSINHDSYRWQLSIYKYLFECQNPSMKVPHLYIFWVRDGKARCVEIQPIKENEVIRLLECKRNRDEIFIPNTDEAPEDLTSILPLSEQKLLAETENKILSLKSAISSLEEIRQKIYTQLASYMEHGPQKLDFGGFTVSYVKGTIRETIDTARLSKDMPEVAETYKKEIKVKPSVRIKMKSASV